MAKTNASSNRENVEEEFNKFAQKISKLESLRKELDALNTKGFEAEVKVIKSKLKNVNAIPNIEKDIASLKRAIRERYSASKIKKIPKKIKIPGKKKKPAKHKTKKTPKKRKTQRIATLIEKKAPTKEKKSSKLSELRKEKDIAMDFATKAHQKFDKLIKASILFGSQANNTAKPGSDIDVILVIDDASIKWDLELVSWYREELAKVISRQKYSRDLHINTIKLTTWWQDLLYGDPVVINILRYGEALIDSGGFFNPLKMLLIQGKVRSTPESVYAALNRAPSHILRSKASEMSAVEGVYWAMVDSAHAALMTAHKLPPSPEHLPQLLKETFVDSGLLKMKYIKALRDIYVLHKSISHGDVNDIRGQEIDNWQDLAEEFLSEMTRIIDEILESRKS